MLEGFVWIEHEVAVGSGNWTAELVGLAIVKAFVTLDRLPKIGTSQGMGSSWPSTMVEWGDQIAWEELTPAEKQERREIANRTKNLPSSVEISQMEVAFDWLRELRIEDSGMALIVSFWALTTARGRSIKRLIIEKHWAPRTFFRKRHKALESLAGSLNLREIRVF